MEDVLEKYKRYGVHWNWISNILTVRKPIPVIDFLSLKMDIARCGVKLSNLIVERRR